MKERDVIDVGMNIGDSSIYFSINGANRVIGLETSPYAFSLAEKNVTLNRLNNVILLNAGYGKDSITSIDQTNI
jgi:FkbM family methyltransferase